MATSAIAGYKGVFGFSTSSTGGTISELGELRNFSVTFEHTEIDATSHESSGFREVIGGIASWSGDAEHLHVMGNATHKAVFDLLSGKTKVDMEFFPTGSSSDGYYSGDGYFTNWNLSSPNEDALATNISFVGTGALTRSSSST